MVQKIDKLGSRVEVSSLLTVTSLAWANTLTYYNMEAIVTSKIVGNAKKSDEYLK